jgi:cytochrome c-type biogenesis protein CcmE
VDTEAVTEASSGRGKWIAGISLIVAAIAGLAAWAFLSPGALAYYKTPTEIKALHVGSGDDRSFRVGGRLKDGTLDHAGSTVSFVITDGKSDVAVSYHGEVPDTLKEGTDVIAEGRRWTSSGTFLASRIQAKCSSKFVPKDRPGDLGKT